MHKISCHCKSVEIEVNSSNLLDNLIRCNCSICKRRGAIMAIVDYDNIKVVKGEDKISLYQFHTRTAKHYFCSVCGIYTHHQTRVNINKYGINVGCIDEINSLELVNIKNNDGANHPLDK